MDVGPCFDTGEQPDCGGMRDVAATAQGWVAVGATHVDSTQGHPWTAAWTSNDGLTWTRAGASMHLSGFLSKVAAGAIGLATVGTSCDPDCSASNAVGFAATSVDGATWTGNMSVFPAPTMWDIASIGGSTFAIGVSDPGAGGPVTLRLWRADDRVKWQRMSSLPAIADATAYRSLSLAGSSDRLVVAGWAEVAAKGTSRSFSFSSPPAFSATNETIPSHVGHVREPQQLRGHPPRVGDDGLGCERLRLLSDDDSAKTWTMVRPPGWSAVAAGLVAVIDADTLYAALPGSPTTIAATHDGGLTWTQATIDEPGCERTDADIHGP